MNKLESTELKQLQELQKKTENILMLLGQISYNEIILEEKKDNIKLDLKNIQDEEKTLKDYLILKYGDIEINIENGEF
jgi:hypothetical protein